VLKLFAPSNYAVSFKKHLKETERSRFKTKAYIYLVRVILALTFRNKVFHKKSGASRASAFCWLSLHPHNERLLVCNQNPKLVGNTEPVLPNDYPVSIHRVKHRYIIVAVHIKVATLKLKLACARWLSEADRVALSGGNGRDVVKVEGSDGPGLADKVLEATIGRVKYGHLGRVRPTVNLGDAEVPRVG
jgi:hypothetical protein